MESHGYSFLNNMGAYEHSSWLPLHDYERNRILSFVDPDKIDPMGVGWNERQSLISVGSGGLTGKGWTQGTQARLGYLPRSVAHNDFIFSVIAEEKGFLGSLTVLSLFWISVVQRHSHSRSLTGPFRHAARHWRHRAVRHACVRKHRHDNRLGAHNGHTASLHQLRWLLCA